MTVVPSIESTCLSANFVHSEFVYNFDTEVYDLVEGVENYFLTTDNEEKEAYFFITGLKMGAEQDPQCTSTLVFDVTYTKDGQERTH